MSERKVQVNIDGASYTLLTDESEEQIKDICDYVSGKIAAVKSNKLSYDKELVLASVNIANDLYNVGNRYKELKEISSEALENYPSLLEEHKKTLDRNEVLTKQVDGLSRRVEDLEESKQKLNKKIKVNEESDQTIEKLRQEIERLQKEALTLKAENDKFRESL